MPLVLILKFKKLMRLHDGNCHTRNRNPLGSATDNLLRVNHAYNYINPFKTDINIYKNYIINFDLRCEVNH